MAKHPEDSRGHVRGDIPSPLGVPTSPYSERQAPSSWDDRRGDEDSFDATDVPERRSDDRTDERTEVLVPQRPRRRRVGKIKASIGAAVLAVAGGTALKMLTNRPPSHRPHVESTDPATEQPTSGGTEKPRRPESREIKKLRLKAEITVDTGQLAIDKLSYANGVEIKGFKFKESLNRQDGFYRMSSGIIEFDGRTYQIIGEITGIAGKKSEVFIDLVEQP